MSVIYLFLFFMIGVVAGFALWDWSHKIDQDHGKACNMQACACKKKAEG